MTIAKPGLYANIHAKQERIARGSKEHMRKPSDQGAPSTGDFEKSKKTSKSKKAIYQAAPALMPEFSQPRQRTAASPPKVSASQSPPTGAFTSRHAGGRAIPQTTGTKNALRQ